MTAAEARPPATRADSLRKRIISAAVLIPATLAAHWFGGAAFAALVAFAVVLMCFEWARMIEGRQTSRVFWSLAIAGAGAMTAAAALNYVLAFAFVAAGGLAAAGFSARGAGRPLWALFGALYIIAPSVGLLWMRESVPQGWGLTALLYCVVWAADTGGYVGGRIVGGPKLSPSVSPAKTWAGAIGGVLLGAAAGAAGAVVFLKGEATAFWGLAGACLGLASILGDMAESGFKRLFGLKDMSQLIPGHGGVLDRLDGMIFATTAMALVLYAQSVSERW
ncbi:MAG: phosphatidate cytidylyltransferase [Parvularculaceae bacterium]|nr:phosphatidate cytidylyltransferase [Parvularculaceae bacterium]